VVYRHRNFAAQVEAIREMFALEPGEVDLPTFPLFALFDPALGMTTVIPQMDPTRPATVDPRSIIEPIHDFGVTMMFGSPALLNTVGRYGEREGVRLPSLKRVLSAGAPVPPKVVERFARMLPENARILTPYGASEALPVAVISSREILDETGARTDRGEGVCVGRPVPSIELDLIGVTDDPVATWTSDLQVAAGEIGEIVVKGPQVTTGYFEEPGHDELSKIRDPDGGLRHRMGDLGYRDDRGRLWFVGRKSQRVITSDGTLYTDQCEGVFNSHPAVFRSALVGVGEGSDRIPVICVELERPPAGISKAELADELEAIARRFDHTRFIKHFLIHPGFPVDVRHNAKIGRRQLADWAAKKLRR
jgi:acyl-CoA synthetase (AMP-forming)/AMP-acid ligase II